LEGKGMPVLNTTTNKGNMFVEFSIAYPKIKVGLTGEKTGELRTLLTEVFYGDT
jgi:DnaJ-class molecular chaperone